MLSPGQQMWLDVGQLIRGQIPDSDGHVLPPDAMNGSYELRDLDHATVGQLYEGKLVIDKTYGHASYGCSNCCGMGIPSLIPSPFGGPPGIDNQDFIHSTEQCSGFVDDVTDAGYGWSSSNTAVATLPTRTLHTVAVGTATGGAEIQLAGTHPAPRCPPYIGNPQQPLTVHPTVQISTNPGYVYIGQGDPSVTQINNMAGSGTPAGGSYQWSSTNSGISFDNGQASSVHITASNYTGGTNDTPITLNYTYNGVAAQPATANITKRIFK